MVRNIASSYWDGSATLADRSVRRDLRTLVRFISVYCRKCHADDTKCPVELKTHDVRSIAGGAVELCPPCTKLLAHAFVKRTRCPMNPKPSCKRCSEHCYHPAYRREMQRVMRYSGRELVLSGRIDYLLHLIF